jgi:hypothetical protein
MTARSFDLTCEVLENRLLDKVYVEYWFDNNTHENIAMYQMGNQYMCTIEIEQNASRLNYHIIALDTGNNSCHSNNSMYVKDTISPEIIDNTLQRPTTSDEFEIIADVTDNIGLDHVYLAYWYDNQPPTFVDFDTRHYIINPPWVKKLNYIINATDMNLNSVSISRNLTVIDNDKPIIVDYTAIDKNIIFISAEATDNIAVTKVSVEYWFDDDEVLTEDLGSIGSNYEMKVEIQRNAYTFYYSIRALDTSKNMGNTTLKELVLKEKENKTNGPNETNDKDNIKGSQDNYSWLVILIVILILIVFCIIITYIFVSKKHRKSHRQPSSALETVTPAVKEVIEPTQEPTISSATPVQQEQTTESPTEPLNEPQSEPSVQEQPPIALPVQPSHQQTQQTDQQPVHQVTPMPPIQQNQD